MTKISLEFAENHLVSALATPPYSWLNAIADHLQIKIFQRGNHIILEGETHPCELAADCLQKLYESAQDGEFLKENLPEMAFGENIGMPHNNMSGASKAAKADNTHHHLSPHNLEKLLAQVSNIVEQPMASMQPIQSIQNPQSQNNPLTKNFAVKKSSKISQKFAQAGNNNLQQEHPKLKGKLVNSLNQSQQIYLDAIDNHMLTIGVGPAGTGKTHLAVACGIKLLLEEKVSQIILSRPAVEAGERLGYLPGDMRDKIDPYFQPVYDSLYEFLGKEHTERYLTIGKISLAPLAYMRGRTLKNAFIILDEAQNTTIAQMKMFLTRLGEGSQMVINGDLSQIDLPKPQISGLKDAILRLKNINNIAICHFSIHDSVRHSLVNEILTAYQAQDNGEEKRNI